MDSFQGSGLARNAAAIFAATLLLASCGNAGQENPSGAPTTPSTKAVDTTAPASDAGGNNTREIKGDASHGPTMIAHWRNGSLAQLLSRNPNDVDFPFSPADLEKVVAASLPGEEGGETPVTCEKDGTLRGIGVDPIQCTYTNAEGKKATAHVHATASAIDGVGILVFPEGDGFSNKALADAYLKDGAEVFAYGNGSMWGVDAPVPAKDLSAHVKTSLEELGRGDVKSVTCDGDVSIKDGKNQTTCSITLSSGDTVDAVTVLTHLPGSQENGTVTIAAFPGE